MSLLGWLSMRLRTLSPTFFFWVVKNHFPMDLGRSSLGLVWPDPFLLCSLLFCFEWVVVVVVLSWVGLLHTLACLLQGLLTYLQVRSSVSVFSFFTSVALLWWKQGRKNDLLTHWLRYDTILLLACLSGLDLDGRIGSDRIFFSLV